MGGKGRDFGQKLVAVIVILAMLALMGVPPTVLVFFAVVTYFVWRAVDRSEQHETRRIFDFYLNAHEILRDDERRWFGFEIREVIEQGETVLHTMKDAPPLV
jgi:cell division protein FtsW (lipid II flippase)